MKVTSQNLASCAISLILLGIFAHYSKLSPFHNITFFPNWISVFPKLVLGAIFLVFLLKGKISVGKEIYAAAPFVVSPICFLASPPEFARTIFVLMSLIVAISIGRKSVFPHKIVLYFVLASLLFSFIGIVSSSTLRKSGIFNNPNIFGLYGFFIVFLAHFFEKRTQKALIIIGTLFVVISFSRAALGATILLLALRSSQRIEAKALAVALVCLFVVFGDQIADLLSGFNGLDRIFGTFSDFQKGDWNALTSGRSHIFEDAISAKSEHGALKFEDLRFYNELTQTDNLHNSYLVVYLGGGIVGLVLYASALIFSIAYTRLKGMRHLNCFLASYALLLATEDYVLSIGGYSYYIVFLVFALSTTASGTNDSNHRPN